MTQELVIDRARWSNGGTPEVGTQLYSGSDRKMCCLGFAARQLAGAKIKDIKELSFPKDTSGLNWPQSLAPVEYRLQGSAVSETMDTDLVKKLVKANDEVCVSQRDRESAIRKLMAEGGIKVKFVGKYTRKKRPLWM